MTTRRIIDATLPDTTGMKKIRTATNYLVNPRMGSATGTWSVNAGSSGGVGTLSRVTSGGPFANAPTFGRLTFTTAPTAPGYVIDIHQGSDPNTIDAGDVGKEFQQVTWVRSSCAGVQIAGVIGMFSNTGFVASTFGDTATLAANTWTQLPIAKRVADATTTRIHAEVNLRNAVAQAGDTIDVVAALYRSDDLGAVAPVYRDGDSAGWTWVGAAHDSRSSGAIGIA